MEESLLKEVQVFVFDSLNCGEEMNKYQFIDFLFSKRNGSNLRELGIINQNLERPFNEYFISSSHNTYLEGDQLTSTSSTNSYKKVLLSGCRSVEVDAWDGDNGEPIIFHGHTLTSRIKFEDAIKTIENSSFDASPLPVIISIENHCSQPFREKMAKIMKDVFAEHASMPNLSNVIQTQIFVNQNKTTKQQNNKTTKQQNNKTTKQQKNSNNNQSKTNLK